MAPAAYGAYGTTNGDTFPETQSLSPARARLVGPHFAVQFDRVSFTQHLSHAQAMNFGYFGDMDHGDTDHGDMAHGDDMGGMGHMDDQKAMKGPSLTAASGHRFMILHTVPTLPGLAPALPEYKNNNAPEDKVKGEIRVGGKSVRLPGIVRDLGSDHNVLVSVPTGADPVLAITDAGRTQLLNLRTGRRAGDEVAAYYPLKAAEPVSVSANGDFGGRSAAVAVHSAGPGLQPYADGHGWAGKGKAWLYLGGDVGTQLAAAKGSERLDAELDVARSFTLVLPDGSTVHGAGKASTTAPLPLGVSGRQQAKGDAGGFAQGALSVVFQVPDTFRGGTLRFVPRGTYRYAGKQTEFSVQDPAEPIRLALH